MTSDEYLKWESRLKDGVEAERVAKKEEMERCKLNKKKSGKFWKREGEKTKSVESMSKEDVRWGMDDEKVQGGWRSSSQRN
jgi:hypothetical protein